MFIRNDLNLHTMTTHAKRGTDGENLKKGLFLYI